VTILLGFALHLEEFVKVLIIEELVAVATFTSFAC
jgi:hypothetical protein